MIPNIRIKSDRNNIYGEGKVISANTLLKDYKERTNGKDYGWLINIPMPAAIDYMAKDLGIEYEYC